MRRLTDSADDAGARDFQRRLLDSGIWRNRAWAGQRSAGHERAAYFVLELLNGSTECLRTQVAYCQRTDGGTNGAYNAGQAANYACPFFLRDNQQPTCGMKFTTDRMRFVLITRPTNETVFVQESTGGWSFAFSR
jgi:hypothetical protein